ncbi:uncharacterized protein LOC117094316 isoform X6 [Trachypithecus francoisi]|uniref:uncharacterized protein LOC117094316 isoform X6 n=1 Tax=Trachypithecus francoisi TaxID=54180 RepID=UPI00141BCB7E|nr:uncharacterized protein LOC117094316 isoform X6 [Trachypithecus francoisi]
MWAGPRGPWLAGPGPRPGWLGPRRWALATSSPREGGLGGAGTGPASLQAAPMEGPTMCWSLPQWEEAEVISRKHRPNGHVGGTEPVASSSATEESSRCLPAEVTLGSEPRLPWGRANRKAVSETIKYQENALCYN